MLLLHLPLYIHSTIPLRGLHYWHRYNTKHPACHFVASRRKKLHEIHLWYSTRTARPTSSPWYKLNCWFNGALRCEIRGLYKMVRLCYSCVLHAPLQGIFDAICDTWRGREFHYSLLTAHEESSDWSVTSLFAANRRCVLQYTQSEIMWVAVLSFKYESFVDAEKRREHVRLINKLVYYRIWGQGWKLRVGTIDSAVFVKQQGWHKGITP